MDRRTLDTLTYFPVTEELAWRRYLAQIRTAEPGDYAAREEAAWLELQATLARLAPDPLHAA